MMDDVGNGLYQLVEILKEVTLVEEDRESQKIPRTPI